MGKLAVLLCAWFLALLSAPVFADSVETALMPGKVISGHAKLEGECKNCHVRFNKAGQTDLCLDCHKDVAKDVREKKGYHGKLKDDECRACHTDHKGRGANIAPLNEKSFQHEQTDFVLKGAHAGDKTACRDCHKAGIKFRDTASTCISCHKADDKHKGNLGNACQNCHTEKDWKETRFDHSKTRFALLGKHTDTACKDCHANERYKSTPKDCLSCHRKDDEHKGRYGAKCETCHNEKDWKAPTFNHERDTRYSLRGKHARVKCDSCHKATLKDKLKTTCVACHRADDPHKGGLGEKCESCHNERDWGTSSFNHDKDTKFPLRDKHRAAKCNSCHQGGKYKEKLPSACVSCHKKEDTHKGHFGEKCETCHNEKTWKTSTFNHERDTKYPLRGKHGQVKCASCHIGNLYKDKLQSACYSCHQKDDKHKNQLGRKCESCHSERDWKDARFDHGLSRFPLLGKHVKVECKKCHTTPAFKDAKSDCVACHQQQDVHKKKLGTQCGTCHNARDWKLWDFDHNRRTRFKLDGEHKKVECLACHTRPSDGKVSTSSACASCHEGDDVHEGSFGKQCDRCHETASFKNIKQGSGMSRP